MRKKWVFSEIAMKLLVIVVKQEREGLYILAMLSWFLNKQLDIWLNKMLKDE